MCKIETKNWKDKKIEKILAMEKNFIAVQAVPLVVKNRM